MRSILVHANGVTRRVDSLDPAWLAPGAPERVWVNIDGPTEEDRPLLQETFGFHDLAVEDALAAIHHPKIESYNGFLYVILHEMVPFEELSGPGTRDVDFFVTANALVTVHTARSAAIEAQQAVCLRHHLVLAEGPVALMHRIVDDMVDAYQPVVDVLEARLEALEKVVFEDPSTDPLRAILSLKRDVAALRRVAVPERDVVSRLARREFAEIPEPIAYRFRDVYDHLVRLTEESAFFHDRLTGLLDAHLSTQSNRMNQVMKVLTVIATIFMPLTVLTGLYGMNVPLPHLPGGEAAQFWWVMAIMGTLGGVMLWVFRRMRWL
ncbi:MAG: magnesium transporter CorA family protein [Acidobacteria bacterium]|nr:magnesium transporter CorA family protein [Acidobacteriota bacterium]